MMAQIGSDDDIILAHRVLLAFSQESVQKTWVPMVFCRPEESKYESRQIVVSAVTVDFKGSKE